MPTEPFEPGRAAAHRTVSYPSLSSYVNGSQSPSEANRPRVSWMTTMNPRRAAARGSNAAASRGICLPYGSRISSTGHGPVPPGR